MAELRICSIEGCGNKLKGRGLCEKHRRRTRQYGSPHVTARTPPGELIAWLDEHANVEQEECLEWPYNQHPVAGYGVVNVGKSQVGAHVYMCTLINGEKPEWADVAAHNCGNGKCLNPQHIRWATWKQNSGDMVAHGTRQFGVEHHSAKLTPEIVRSIRELYETKTAKEISALLNVSTGAIYSVARGAVWKHV